MNALQHETSPYLLQHANNPVNWFGWSVETLARAKKENKPILVSIGYATCHWCHVMAHESFEDVATAKFMNENFINIKIDREERPDLDMIYMTACQIFTGGGGWPLNVFLTPEAKPYFAGTYFPPSTDVKFHVSTNYQRPSWREVLITMADAFKNKKEQVYEQAEKITELIAERNNTFGGNKLESKSVKSFLNLEKNDTNKLETIVKTIKQTFDTQFGGFGGAPKFPHAMLLNFLNQFSYYNKTKLGIEAAAHVKKTISRMLDGGIYDQLGGGFARYSVDAAWTVPHFEKMLYDNALLITVIARSMESKDYHFQAGLIETIQCITKELSNLDFNTFEPFGFYSAIDADSEGEEGTFYTWSYDEFCKVLGKKSDILTYAFGVTQSGNLDGKNVLTAFNPDEKFLKEKKLTYRQYNDLVFAGIKKLFAHRSKRERPITDTKMILSWNAMMVSALCTAHQSTKEELYKVYALKSLAFLKQNFYVPKENNLAHTFSKGEQRYAAFLDDYAEYIAALIEAYYLEFDTEYLIEAHHWLKYSIQNFWDEASGAFYYSEANQTDLISRQKDYYDNATPSGNSTMAQNLLKLSIITADLNYRDMAHKMISQILPEVERYPNGFGRWLSAYQSCVEGITEVAVIGRGAKALAQKIYFAQTPNCIIMASETVDKNYPLLNQNALEFVDSEKCCIFVCSDYVCQKPVHSVEEAMAMIYKN